MRTREMSGIATEDDDMTQEAAAMSAPSAGSTTVPFAPYYQDEAVTIYNADCRKVLPFLERFDLMLTDPPYGIGAAGKHFIRQGKQTGKSLCVSGERYYMGNPVGVLVCLPDGERCIGFCDNDEYGVRWQCNSTHKPTHWMPLPQDPLDHA